MPPFFYRLIQAWALANLGFILYCLIFPVSLFGASYAWHSAQILMLVQALVSMAMYYSARQTLLKREIGFKTLPATLVSYLLWLGMVRFWLFTGL
ncbi:hypothetical protein IB286_12245 [Spongiibacter sp. KMU-158]|uniref:Uncharacterized protein n=1 Tax=Spongiibacter pelagi TaxID=2760804 RepID=A0A927GXU3_9GAMM|nr:hypothetical protein [Spongiibacter pelagi]MBD2859774.1 hypothetical protein [Spongiibacter pelagi]